MKLNVRLSRLTALLVLLIACASSIFAASPSGKDFVVVIDPGHGSQDAGAVGKYSKEKDIALAVAKKLSNIFQTQCSDVKVLMTRSTDVFVTLDGRVKKGKEAKADLFISIHCNSAGKTNKERERVQGTEVWVLGPDAADANLDLAIRENQSILLEKDHSTKYQGFDNSPEYYIFNEINQNRMQTKSYDVAAAIQKELVSHAGLVNRGVKQTSKLFLLLHATVPTVLVELDFICNPEREKFLNSEAGQQKMAEAICNGVMKFRGKSPIKSSAAARTSTPTKADSSSREEADVDDAAEASVFKIQFLSSTKLLKAGSADFKSLTPVDHYRDGKCYRYTYGEYPSQKAATADLAKVKKKFSDAFVIETKNGKRIK